MVSLCGLIIFGEIVSFVFGKLKIIRKKWIFIVLSWLYELNFEERKIDLINIWLGVMKVGVEEI